MLANPTETCSEPVFCFLRIANVECILLNLKQYCTER